LQTTISENIGSSNREHGKNRTLFRRRSQSNELAYQRSTDMAKEHRSASDARTSGAHVTSTWSLHFPCVLQFRAEVPPRHRVVPTGGMTPREQRALPSSNVFSRAWIWLACKPNRLDNSATVPSSRTAASATFALNSGHVSCVYSPCLTSGNRPLEGGISWLPFCPIFRVHLNPAESTDHAL
jgi:hypothetical protein